MTNSRRFPVVVRVVSLLVILSTVAGTVPLAGSAATPADVGPDSPESASSGSSTADGVDPGTIETLQVYNATDSNENGEYAAFDLYIEADSTLPAGNDDDDGDAEPRLKVLVNGEAVYENVEVAATTDLSGRIPIPNSSLPARDVEALNVTVILWEDDPVENDVLDRYSISVPYEADESELRIRASRTATVAGSPVYLEADGGTSRTGWALTRSPAGSEASLRSHTETTLVLRPDEAGTYVVTAESEDGTRTTREIEVVERSDLIDRYAPVLYYDERETYRPTRYEAMVENANLYDDDIASDDLLVRSPSMLDLGVYEDEPILDLDGEQTDYPSYDDGYPPTVYATVDSDVTFRGESYTAITYWLFYVYDPKTEGLPKLADHQSDLETVTVLVNEEGPQWVAASQHHGGELREWEKVSKTGNRIHVYPALGAHSNYLTNTDRFDGNGLIGQRQHVGKIYNRTTEKLSLYSDTTGSDRVLSPTGSHGTAYEIVPLTGDEAWAEFNGGFASDYDSGQVPMQRQRWTDVGTWIEETLLPDENQRKLSIESLDSSASGESLRVAAEVSNVGPKPTTAYLFVFAKPSDAAWDEDGSTYLGALSGDLGTERTKRFRGSVEAATDVSGSWDVLVVASPYPYDLTESEDVSASAQIEGAYEVSAEATRTTTSEPTEAESTTTTTRPATTTAAETTTSPETTAGPETTTAANGDGSDETHSSTPESTSDGQSQESGTPGFGVTAAVLAVGLVLAGRRCT